MEPNNIIDSFMGLIPLTDMTVGFFSAETLAEQPQRFGTRFILLEKLGKGQFGTVWKVFDRVFSKYMAIKIQKDPKQKAENQENINEEHKLNKKIKTLDQMGLFLDYYGLQMLDQMCVMGFETGATSLGKIIKNGKIYNFEEAVYVLGELLPQFIFLESHGIAHCDVKPDNFILALPKNQSQYFLYKLSDFGISVLLENSKKITPDNCTSLTEKYASPEVKEFFKLKKKGEMNIEYDPFKGDVYSLGMTVLRMLGLDLKKSKWKISLKGIPGGKKIYNILKSMLREDPEKRISFSELKIKVDELGKKPPSDEQSYFYPIKDPKKSVQQLLLLFHTYFDHLNLVEQSAKTLDQISKIISDNPILFENSELKAKWFHCEAWLKLALFQKSDDDAELYKKSESSLKEAIKIYKILGKVEKIGLAYSDLGLLKFYGRTMHDRRDFIQEFDESHRIFEELIKEIGASQEDEMKTLKHLALVPTYFCALSRLYSNNRDEGFKIYDKFFRFFHDLYSHLEFLKPIEHEEDIFFNMKILEHDKIEIERKFLSERVVLFDEQQCEGASISNFYDNLARFFFSKENLVYALDLERNCYKIRKILLPKDNTYVQVSRNFKKMIKNKMNLKRKL